ncbi:unnamed protein product [Rotaria magnacalcarata]|uniref:G-patch domain-containing protein n=2 Tax=Rotaria magnacalcarata TaxID=392030 RepID=A0A816SCX1_9BILA|nr:unnamed protein product [Rotaria magnacalcarata]
MSRTQQKLQAMSAQELLIQEKKRIIEEKLRLDNTKKSNPNDSVPQNNINNIVEHQTMGNNAFRNDGPFLEQFRKAQGQPSTLIPSDAKNLNSNTQQSLSRGPQYLATNSYSQFGPSWFPSSSQPPSMFDQHNGSPSFPVHPLSFNPSALPPPPPPLPPSFNLPSAFPPSSLPTTSNPSNYAPSTTSFALPSPELLSKMLQTPPPPLPVPAPINNPSTTTTANNNINNADLYDPLKAEDEDEEDNEQKKTPAQKPASRTFNIKKEYTIKIEPNSSTNTNNNLSSIEHEQQKHDNGGNRRRQVATTSTELSSSSALWWDNNEDSDEEKTNSVNKSMTDTQKVEENNRKRKSRWGNHSVKHEPNEYKFVEQIHEATEKAKRFVTQLNEQMKLYPEGYDGTKMNAEQRGQFVEQKELQSIYQTMMVKRRELENLARQQQHKREYDSDEETDSKAGTWEHRLRATEMDITREWAVKLTDMAHGKHHIGDFIPAHELEKFMKTYSALKDGETPDVSDYRDFKIQAENIGYRLLEKFGWKEGHGLGKNLQGIVTPVNKGTTPVHHAGLGQDRPSELDRNDDEFQMYRKRMMLAYRFRPNPLNNPRRDYY